MFGIDMVIFWTVLAIFLVIVEALSMGLTTIWFAFGALFTILIAMLNFNIIIQFIVFFASSFILLIYTRPIAVKFLKIGTTKTNVDSLIGKEGLVLKQINTFEIGQVKVEGQIWSARSSEKGEILEGKRIRVEGIEGVKLIVSEIYTSSKE